MNSFKKLREECGCKLCKAELKGYTQAIKEEIEFLEDVDLFMGDCITMVNTANKSCLIDCINQRRDNNKQRLLKLKSTLGAK